MRLSLPIAILATLGCGKQESTKDTPGPVAPVQPVVAVEKKPLDTRPLPPLAEDPGGATGKPVAGIGFGGLGIEAPTGVVVGPAGEVYVCGYFDGEMDIPGIGKLAPTPPTPPRPGAQNPKVEKPTDAFLARIDFDAKGAAKIAWMKTWGDKRDDVAKGIAIQGDTLVVVGNFLDRLDIETRPETSQHPASGSDDLYAAAFDTSGKLRWVWTVGGIDSDGANAVAAAPDGGWYVGGSFRKTIKIAEVEYKAKGRSDALLIKLSKTGTPEWVKHFGGAYDDTILHLASDARGNIYVQGEFGYQSDWGGETLVASGSDEDIVLAKYDANGDHAWSRRFGSGFDDVAGGIAIDPAGNITIVGSFDRTISFGEGDDHVSNGEADIYIARFDNAGTLSWARTYGADRNDLAWGVAADASGNTVTTGWFEGSVDFGKTTLGKVTSKGNKDVFAIKHDANGAVVWVQTWGDKDHDQGRAVAVDAAGAAYVAGLFRFTLGVVTPPLESVRAEGDRIPKPDTFLLRLDR
jgi:hypothetical protein